eukprot:329279_1
MEDNGTQPLVENHDQQNLPQLSTQGSNHSNNPSFKCNLSESPLPQKRYTIDEALEKIGFGSYQIRILIVTGSFLSSNAAEIVILSFLLPILKDEWNLKQDINSIIGAAVFFGMLIGTILWRYISEKYGRIPALKLCIIGQIIFGTCCGLSPNIYWITVLKLFHGLCLGGTGVAFRLYSEWCPQQIRNKLFLRQLSFWVIGTVINTSFAWLILETQHWSWYLIISSLSMIIVLIFTFCISESPQWLMASKDIDEAHIALLKAAKLNRHILPKGSLKKSSKVFNFGYNNYSPKYWINNEWKQIFSARYYNTSISLYIIAFCCIFGYFGMVLLAVRFFTEYHSNESMFYLKIFVAACAEIPCVFIVSKAKSTSKSALMVSFIIFALCMITLSLRIDLDIVVIAVTVLFIGRMCIFFAFLKVYVIIGGYYGNMLSDGAIELVYIIGILSAIVSVVVSQANDVVWAWYIYALSGVVSFVASCTLKIGRIHSKTQLMKNVDYKSMDRTGCEKIEENHVEMN